MAADETVAVLGAGGTMGQGMARNLLKAGMTVRAWNRSTEKAQPLADDGAEVCDSLEEAVTGATIVLTMLTNGDAVIESMQAALDADLGAEAIWLQMSTIGEAATDRCCELARDRNIELVDAPVSGTKQPAEEGKLVIFASGPERLHERLQPLFDALGQRTMWVGGAGAGTRLKLATNAWLVAVVEGAAEALALAEGLELDPRLLLEAVEGGPLDAPYLQMKGKAMIERDFEPSFQLSLATKDAALAQESAEARGLDLPMLAAIRQRMEDAVPEHGDEDLSVTFLSSAPGAGTPA